MAMAHHGTVAQQPGEPESGSKPRDRVGLMTKLAIAFAIVALGIAVASTAFGLG